MPDWSAIKADFLATGMSYSSLAKKWEVPLSTVKKRAMREKWMRSHEVVVLQAEEEALREMEPPVPVPSETDEEMEPEELPVPLQVEQVTPEMLAAELRARRARRMLEATDAMMGRVIEALDIIKPDDTYALSTLVRALKDLREIQGLNRTELDIEEQKARIAKMRSETRITETEGAGGVLILPAIDERLEPPEEEP